MNKKIKTIFSFILLFLLMIPLLSFAAEKTDQYYIDRVALVQNNITFKINSIIPSFNHISDDYKNSLISEFQNYNSSLNDFETTAINGGCSVDIRFDNFLINKAKAAVSGVEDPEGGGTCIPASAEDLFRDAIKGDRSLSKKIFTYKSCDNLLDLIEDNLTLVNTILYLLDDQGNGLGMSGNATLISNLESNKQGLEMLIQDIDNVITNFGSVGYENYDQINTLRQQFVDRDSGDYVTFFNDYTTINGSIMSNIQQALPLLSAVSTNNSYIHPNKRYFYNDEVLSLDVALRDYFGEPLPGLNVALIAYQNDSTSGLNISPAGIQTNSNGVAKNFRLTSTISGKIDFKAVIEGSTEIEISDVSTAMQAFSADNSSIQADPTSIKVGQDSQVTVTVRDIYGELIRGKNVRINTIVADPTVNISPLSGRTNEEGEIVFQVSKSSKGTIGTKVDIDYAEILSENLIQVALPISSEYSSIQANPEEITILPRPGAPATEGYYSIVTVRVLSDKREPISGERVVLISKQGQENVLISPELVVTDKNGLADFKVSSLIEGSISFVANIEGFEIMAIDLLTANLPSGGGSGTTPEECKKGGGKWDEETSTCVCIEGVWDETAKRCIPLEMLIEECKKGGGEWDEERSTCVCIEGVWDETAKRCIPLEMLIEECRNGGGRWDEKTSTCICVEEGFVWNETTKRCEK